jgi:hypothetical protein
VAIGHNHKMDEVLINWSKATEMFTPGVRVLPERKPKAPEIVSGYLHCVYDTDRYARTLNDLTNAMKDNSDFDVIAFRGTSGAAVAFTLSLKLGKPVMQIRKRSAKSHTSLSVEGMIGAPRVAIVDDFTETGNTLRQIKKKVIAAYVARGYNEPTFPHCFLYRDCNVPMAAVRALPDTKIHVVGE